MKKVNPEKFRASFSTLSAWSSGDYERAVDMYFGLTDFVTPAMEEGRRFHKEWDTEIKKTGCFPKVFGGKKIKGEFKTELFVQRELDKWLEVVGFIDMQAGDTLYDWKTGKTTSDSYAGSFQAKVYQLLVPNSKRFEFHHYDQYQKTTDVSIVHLTDETLEKGINWILTHSSEMHNYLQETGLYERYC